MDYDWLLKRHLPLYYFKISIIEVYSKAISDPITSISLINWIKLFSNIISSMVEYFSFINLLSWFLFIFIIFFSIVIISTLLYYSTVNFNRGNFNLSIVEFISTLFSFFFLILIIPPALIILFDFDVIIIPTFILYSPGLQWSRHCHILFLPRHI